MGGDAQPLVAKRRGGFHKHRDDRAHGNDVVDFHPWLMP